MKTISKEEIEKEAKLIAEPFDSRYGACLRMAEWMEQQLEPLITELSMDKARLRMRLRYILKHAGSMQECKETAEQALQSETK